MFRKRAHKITFRMIRALLTIGRSLLAGILMAIVSLLRILLSSRIRYRKGIKGGLLILSTKKNKIKI